jgi:hypothetical protein
MYLEVYFNAEDMEESIIKIESVVVDNAVKQQEPERKIKEELKKC